ncbi:MAG: hypothetical protein FWE42_08530 [Defluviitaleaceae bacterium]|nr:hypothetical protein [Defluviitaleaceae bacterium]
MIYCTQCGTLLQDGQVCECLKANNFCTQCGNQLPEGQVCACTIKLPPEPPPVLANEPKIQKSQSTIPKVEKHAQSKPIPANIKTYVDKPVTTKEANEKVIETPHASANMVPGQVKPMSGEVPIKQYHIANINNLLRINRTAGYLEITSKRIIYRAEKHTYISSSTTHNEFAIEEIAGLEVTNNHRFSIARCAIGLTIIAGFSALIAWAVIALTFGFFGDAYTVDFMTRPTLRQVLPWVFERLGQDRHADIGNLSMITGLIAGFGGIALFFLFKGKLLLKQFLLGMSFGGFAAVALTYNTYAFVLLALSSLCAIFGLGLFSTVSDLVISVLNKGGDKVCLVRARRLADIFHGSYGIGYAEIAPTDETDAAAQELGAIIGDVQKLGVDGVERWREP